MLAVVNPRQSDLFDRREPGPSRDELLRTGALGGDGVERWLGTVSGTEANRPVEMSHVLRDGDNVVGVHLPSGEDVAAAVYIDHNLGTLAKDAIATGAIIFPPFETDT